MRDTTEVLQQLRRLMQSLPNHPELSIVAYIVPTDDAHGSEYIAKHDQRRAFITGFDGSGQ